MTPTPFRTYELALQLYRDCESVRCPSRHIRDQLHRAALSVVLNLNEGAARPTKPDKRRFYSMAYGSVREIQGLCRVLNNADLFRVADTVGAFTYKLIRNT